MNIIVDIVLAVLFLIVVVVAAKKGFALSVLEVGAFVIAVVLSIQLASPFASAVYDGFMKKGVESKIEEALPNDAQGVTYAKKASAVLDSIPSFYASYAEKIGINISELSNKIMTSNFTNENIANQLQEKVAKPIVVSVMKGILFIIMCIVFGAILKAAARGINKMFKLPIIGTANMLLGAVIGVLKGGILMIIICSVLTFIAPKTNDQFKKAVDSSKIVSLANELNPMQIFNK